ncbi:hypothetical protein [Rubellicoccus peritrichatus]|uniref:PEP-CTERM protein-sorting domain-containing protein n=1 Tax=Rubellicoccus peritrichatus TaxID=3080537 RepID=A0AAQ3L6D9_9BACT|nr:hypothetical protein [Puniceicoccus sp. CR14]WOO39816.1 hypothetical protein RZN69_14420 [Puniceicoccus sp. CR14]
MLVTWGSTIDDGDLEGVGSIYTSSILDSAQGSGLGGADNNDNISGSSQISGGEINYYSAAGGEADDTTTAADAIADQQYFEFSFTVDGLSGGQTLTLESFSYDTRVNFNSSSGRIGWQDSQLAYRINDTSFSSADLIGSVNNDPDSGDIDSFVVNEGMPSGIVSGDVVNFRLYVWGSNNVGSGTTFHSSTRLGNIDIEGTVVPEPAYYVSMVGIGVLALAILRRQKPSGSR